MQVTLSPETFLAGYSATKAAVENGDLQAGFAKCAAVFRNSPDQNKQLEDLLENFKQLEGKYNLAVSPQLTNSITLYDDLRERSEELKKLDVTQALASISVSEGPKLGRSGGVRR